MKENLVRAYWAGMIDGDGCISFHKFGKAKTATPEITLKMTNLETVTAFAKVFGLKVEAVNTPSARNSYEELGHAQQYVARCAAKKAYFIIKALSPWLFIKHEKAKQAIGLYENRTCVACGKQIGLDKGLNSKTCSVQCYRSKKRDYVENTHFCDALVPGFSNEEEKLAYTAGILDSEGHIEIRTTSNGDDYGKLVVNMADESTIKLLAMTWNVEYRRISGINKLKREAENNWRPIYNVILSGYSAAIFLKKIVNFMITKKLIAEQYILLHEEKKKRSLNSAFPVLASYEL